MFVSVFDTVSTTDFLARVIGLYFLAAGIGLFFNPRVYQAVITDMRDTPMFRFLAGLIAFAVGVAILSIHEVWSGWPAGFITLIAWISVIKGLVVLAMPRPFMGLAVAAFSHPLLLRLIALAVIALGGALLWVGGMPDTFAETYLTFG